MINEESLNGLFFSSLIVLLASFVISSYIIYETAYQQQRTVVSLTSPKACGHCLDLAVEPYPAADFSFLNCPEKLKKWSVASQPDTWSAQKPVEDAKMVEDYEDVNKNAFKRGWSTDTFNYSREPHFDRTCWIVIGINAGMPIFFTLFTLWGVIEGRKIILSVTNTVWVYYIAWSSLITVAALEIQQKQSFGDIDCMMFPSGYSFYSLFVILPSLFSIYTIILLATHMISDGGRTCCKRFWLMLEVTWPFVLLAMDIFFLISLHKSHSKAFVPLLLLFLVVFAFTMAFYPMFILTILGVQVAEVFILPFFNSVTGEDEQPLMQGP